VGGPSPTASAPDGATDRAALAALAGATAGIVHLVLIPQHLDDPAYVAGFGAAGVAQFAWAWALWVRSESRALLRTGIVLQLGLAALWLVSRLIGLPFVAEPWDPVGVGPLDAVTVAVELLAAALCAALLGRRMPPRLDGLTMIAVALAFSSVFAGVGHGH
jgi:hypothetical protein